MLGVVLHLERVSVVYGAVAPRFLGGFGIMLVSGAMLFAGFATSAYGNTYFRIKMVLLILDGINAGVYHLVIQRVSPGWDAATAPPVPVRLSALVSLVLWTSSSLRAV